MATKHEPQPWDLYRTPRGGLYLIVFAHTTRANVVRVIDYGEGTSFWLECERMEHDEFKGTVLALPQLIAACDEAMNVLVACAVPGPGCDDKQALSHSRATLYAALLKAGIKH